MTRPIDPEPKRCGQCDVRLSRARPHDEEACFRTANGWPALEDDDSARAATGEGFCIFGGAPCPNTCAREGACLWRDSEARRGG